jgi:transposase
VDDAGQGIPVVNSHSGEVHAGAIVVAVLGASNSTYAEAPWPPSLPDGIGSHGRTCAALGGVPESVVPENLKAAVPRAHRYAPAINRPYAALAQPYGFALMPARAAKPRDKATGEVGVQIVERGMLARLRPPTFFSLADVHAALPPRLAGLNARPCKKWPGSRQQLVEALDRLALRPLPTPPYAYAEWKHARGNIDDPVEVAGHDSSGP